ncbi:hypothetical protein SDC9_68722 [bioreactor metagenome]|uniref:Uncharacterized protein n=1 Tax=bioreactor metagenome TaxID=1076179 RepID=A0A644Y2W6_9ZZZZ
MLHAVAVARRKLRGLHPAVFLRKMLVGVVHHVAPYGNQFDVFGHVHRLQQFDQLLVCLVHQRQVQDHPVRPLQSPHLSFLPGEARLRMRAHRACRSAEEEG